MKILVLSNLYPPDVIGGYEVACAQMADALRGRGHEVLVLTTAARAPVGACGHVRRTLKLTDIWNREWMTRQPTAAQRRLDAESRLVHAFNVQQLAAALEEFAPDVCYVSNVTGLGGLAMMATLRHLGVPWVWQLADSVPSYVCGVWDQVVPALARAFTDGLGGTFVSVSTRLVNEIEGTGVRLPGRLEVLPYWIDGRRPAMGRSQYRREGILRVVNAGRLTPYKGVDLLIEAMARLRAEGDERVRLDLIGGVGDVDEAYYPALIARQGVDDRVRLLGRIDHDQLMSMYADYDVFAFPTWEREPFGLGPVEAAAHGGCVPLIAQNCGLAEWLAHGVHCLKAEPTVEAFANVLTRLAAGEIDLAGLGRRAGAMAWRDLHVDAVAPRLERILIDAAGSRPRAIGTAAEAERMAILAEKLMDVMIAEAAA